MHMSHVGVNKNKVSGYGTKIPRAAMCSVTGKLTIIAKICGVGLTSLAHPRLQRLAKFLTFSRGKFLGRYPGNPSRGPVLLGVTVVTVVTVKNHIAIGTRGAHRLFLYRVCITHYAI
jgi:hypothetical protein